MKRGTGHAECRRDGRRCSNATRSQAGKYETDENVLRVGSWSRLVREHTVVGGGGNMSKTGRHRRQTEVSQCRSTRAARVAASSCIAHGHTCVGNRARCVVVVARAGVRRVVQRKIRTTMKCEASAQAPPQPFDVAVNQRQHPYRKIRCRWRERQMRRICSAGEGTNTRYARQTRRTRKQAAREKKMRDSRNKRSGN